MNILNTTYNNQSDRLIRAYVGYLVSRALAILILSILIVLIFHNMKENFEKLFYNVNVGTL